MKAIKCQCCNKEVIGTKRKKFCGDACRSQHWRNQRKDSAVIDAQLRAISNTMILKDKAIAGDRLALKALEQVEKILRMAELGLRYGELPA